MTDYIVKFADYIDEQFQTPWATPNRQDAPFVKILRKLMTQDDAAFVMSCLTPAPMTVEEIAAKVGKKPEEFVPILDKLVSNGVIFDAINNGVHTYKLVPIAPGILEFQMNARTLDDEMVALLWEYYEELSASEYPNLPVGTMRIIPVAQAIEADEKRCSYEDVMTFINATDRYAVAPCLCRSLMRAQGQGCGHMIETCMLFGEYADYYVRTGRGRYLSREEIIELLDKCEKDGLVHHVFSFDKGFSEYICNCCDCCCIGIPFAKNPATRGVIATSRYRADVDAGSCTACGLCIEVCPVKAISENGSDAVAVDPALCIGCGLCAFECPVAAIGLKQVHPASFIPA